MAKRNRNRGAQAQARREPAPQPQAEAPQAAPQQDNGSSSELKFSPAYKYETVDKRAKDGKLDYDPQWAKKDARFFAGRPPKGDKSVFATIFKHVQEHQGDKGILGSTLAGQLRYLRYPNPPRSQYLKDGVPAVGWAEGYINGAVTKSILKMVRADGEPDNRRRKAAEGSKPTAESKAESKDEGEREVQEVSEEDVGAVKDVVTAGDTPQEIEQAVEQEVVEGSPEATNGNGDNGPEDEDESEEDNGESEDEDGGEAA